jgi:hypothetical protein
VVSIIQCAHQSAAIAILCACPARACSRWRAPTCAPFSFHTHHYYHPPWAMERPHHLDAERYSLEEDTLQRSFDDGAPLNSASVREGLHLASLAEKKRLWWRNAIINTIFIASWYVWRLSAALLLTWTQSCWCRFLFATLLSLYNKWMFSPEHLAFPAPVFVTTMHMFVQFLLAAALRIFWPKTFKPQHNPTAKDYGYVFLFYSQGCLGPSSVFKARRSSQRRWRRA